MDKWLEQGYAIWLIVAVTAAGILARSILWGYYRQILLACQNMSSTKNRAIRGMREQFVNRYQAEFGVHNVDIFVDKYLINCRLCKILLSTWENFCGQTVWCSLLFSALSAFLTMLYGLSSKLILSTIFVGLCGTTLLIIFDGMGQLSTKKRRLRTCLRDYLENCFRVRLENEFENLKQAGEPKNRVKIAEAQLAITDEALYKKQQKKQRKEEGLQEKQESKKMKHEIRFQKQKEKRAKQWTARTERTAKRTEKQERRKWDAAEKNRLREELLAQRKQPEKNIKESVEEIAAASIRPTEEKKENRQADMLIQSVQEEKKWEELIEDVLKEYLS